MPGRAGSPLRVAATRSALNSRERARAICSRPLSAGAASINSTTGSGTLITPRASAGSVNSSPSPPTRANPPVKRRMDPARLASHTSLAWM